MPGLRLELQNRVRATCSYVVSPLPMGLPVTKQAVMCIECGRDCWFIDSNYYWCRPCQEHHRPPECAINELGQPLAPCGHPWVDVMTPRLYCPHDDA